MRNSSYAFTAKEARLPGVEAGPPRRPTATGSGASVFDASVPVTTIAVRNPAVEAIPKAEREHIGEKVTHRLAQRPASYEGRPVASRAWYGRTG